MLQNRYPHIMARIKRRLRYYVRRTEKKAGGVPNSFWYREFHPNDPQLGGTDKVYWVTFTNTTEEHLLAQAAAFTVPVANAYVSFGWYIDFDGGYGYVQSKKQTVVKQEIPISIIYQAKDPKHLYLDFDHVIFCEEQQLIDFVIYSAFGADQKGFGFPVLFRIASRAALKLEGGS